jgi:hypothetical protein
MKIGLCVRAALPALLIGSGLGLAPVYAQTATAPLAPEAVPSQEAAQLRAALRGQSAGLPSEVADALDGFYSARGFAPYWTEGTGARAQELLAVLDGSWPATDVHTILFDLR